MKFSERTALMDKWPCKPSNTVTVPRITFPLILVYAFSRHPRQSKAATGMRTRTLSGFFISFFYIVTYVTADTHSSTTLELRKKQRQSNNIDQQSASLWKCSIYLEQKFYKENALCSFRTSNFLGQCMSSKMLDSLLLYCKSLLPLLGSPLFTRQGLTH